MTDFSVIKRLALLVLPVLLAACGSTPPELQPSELQDIEPRVGFEQLWSVGLSGHERGYAKLVPALSGDHIYVADPGGRVMALDRETGERIWQVDLDVEIAGAVGAGPDAVLLGTYGAEVLALDAEDGSERWRESVSSEVLSPPQSNSRITVAQTFDGTLVALDSETGAELWSYESNMPVLTLRGTATPLLTGGNIYAGFADGKLVALDADDGLLNWEQRVAVPQGRSELERMVDVDSSPLRVGNIVFAASYQGEVMALSRATGRSLWSQSASTFSDLAAGDGQLYLVDADGGIIAYGQNSGREQWSSDELLRRKVSAPAALDGFVAVADEEGGYVHLLNAEDGEIVARRKVDGAGIRAPMLAADGTLYVYSMGGDLVALRLRPLEDGG